MPKTEETVNVRIYKSTHEHLKSMSEKRRQQLIVVLDEIIKKELILK